MKRGKCGFNKFNDREMKRYTDSIKLAELVGKDLKGDLSLEERDMLDDFIKDNPSFISNTREESAIGEKIAQYNQYDIDKCWNNVLQATKKKRRISIGMISRYAAAILLPVLIITAFFIITEQKIQSPEKVSEIVRVPNKTILEISSGEKIVLGDSLEEAKLLKEGAKVEGKKNLSYSKTLKSSTATDSLPKIKYHKIIVPKGGEYKLQLADGTNVYLFSESSLKYPSNFRGKKREVSLSGEAYFEVSHDPSHPFVVKTKELNVNVLGTNFNVMAYEDSEVVETSLIEGKVSVKGDVLLPATQSVFNKLSGKTDIKKINTQRYIERKNGYFVFENEKLDNILQELSRWYDFKFFYQNSEMENKLFGFKLQKYDNISSILRLIEETKEVKFRIKGKTIIVQSVK